MCRLINVLTWHTPLIRIYHTRASVCMPQCAHHQGLDNKNIAAPRMRNVLSIDVKIHMNFSELYKVKNVSKRS